MPSATVRRKASKTWHNVPSNIYTKVLWGCSFKDKNYAICYHVSWYTIKINLMVFLPSCTKYIMLYMCPNNQSL